MKHFLLLIFTCGLLGFTNDAKAQEYFTYDCDEFSVLLTCNSSNEIIMNVEFSFGNEWVPFTILDYYDGGDDGFLYSVADGEGTKYTLIYLYGGDNVVVESGDETTHWVLSRRDD